MSGAIHKLSKLQVGTETVKGTGVPATARLIGANTWKDASVKGTVERDYGLLPSHREAAPILTFLSEVEHESELSFEQILFPIYSGFADTLPGAEQTPSQSDFLYDFVTPTTTQPSIKTLTFEGVEADGAADIQTFEANYGACSRFGISAQKGDNFAQLSASWFARETKVAAATAAIAIPVRELIPAELFTVAYAATFALLDPTPTVQAGILGIDWELTTGLGPKRRLAGSLDFADEQFGMGRVATLSLTIDLLAFSETERVSFFRAAAQRFIRIEAVGSQMGTGINKRITFDGAYELIDPPEPGDDEGQTTWVLNYRSIYDDTAAKDIELHVANGLTALP